MEDFDFGLPDAAAVSFSCPHCGHSVADDLELVETGLAHLVRCEACKRDFHLALMECPRCAADSVFQWTQAPSEQETSRLRCMQCGRPFADDADGIDEALE